ncbi:MAG TPA: pyridoxal phosphate-dependent aminotransferase [Fimbriimonadaceae bacterium]|nr:pyridoxal phosphate-dependent aminotransferase [Fimbriimonadaceae bacterium]HRJ95483.1 pyridoxal phosphate-dependent aminotransferase [Fimbriimonadaceae bacterium]
MTTLGLSARAGMLEPSPTLAMTAKARRMKIEGIDVVSFAAGEPDFNTPLPVCEAAERAIHDGQTKYTATAGILALREAISRKLARENNLDYGPDQVVVTCGAKHAVFSALQILVDPGDEVILIAPFWMTYVDQVRLAGGIPVIIQTGSDTGFSPTVEQIAGAITARTKAIVLNSPCNPTGAIIEKETLAGIGDLALRHGFWIVADEIYERLTYGHAYQSAAALGAEVAAQTITIGGVSKTYSMTGWRIGFAAAPLHVAKALCNLQDQVTSNANSIAQAAATAAYDLPDEFVTKMRNEFRDRRDLMVGLLRNIPGLACETPEGAFYVFPDVRACLSRFSTDAQLADYLLDAAHVATMPGSVFHGPGHLRLSYAASRQDIERGVARIGDALAQATR